MNINGIPIAVCTENHKITIAIRVQYSTNVKRFVRMCDNGFIPPEELATQINNLTAIYSTGNSFYDNESANLSDLKKVFQDMVAYQPGGEFYKKYFNKTESSS